MDICGALKETIFMTAGAAAGAGLVAASGALVATSAATGLLYGAIGGGVFSVTMIATFDWEKDQLIKILVAAVLAILAATILTPLILGVKISSTLICAELLLTPPAALSLYGASLAGNAIQEECCPEPEPD